MSNAKQLHHAAMNSLQQADVALMRRDILLYELMLRHALTLETDAAMLLKDKITAEPTRSVLFRSAASIAISCGEYKHAEKLVVDALRGEPPREIKHELLELFNDALVEPFVISAGKSVVKRIFDIAFSTLVLFGLLPLFILIAILIQIESRGPVFYSQIRIGKNNRAFRCFKFRTMKIDSEDNVYSTISGERVTALGALLRRFSVDELPQFINVLKGEMTVVGPRPRLLPMERSSTYSQIINLFRVRHTAMPGITGLVQTSELTSEPKSYAQYTQQWSLLLDFKIILLAIMQKVFRGPKNTYSTAADGGIEQ